MTTSVSTAIAAEVSKNIGLDVDVTAGCADMPADQLAEFVTGYELGTLTTSIISSERAPYGARRAVAAKLNMLMPELPWYNTVSTDTTEAAKAFEEHRKAIVKTLKARDKKYNTAQAIKKIKEIGAELAGAVEEPAADAESAGGSRKRWPHDRIKAECMPMFKAFGLPSAAGEAEIRERYKDHPSITAEQIFSFGQKLGALMRDELGIDIDVSDS
jgi:hypothetical protein